MIKKILLALVFALVASVAIAAPAYAAGCSVSGMPLASMDLTTGDTRVGGGHWATVNLYREVRYNASENCVVAVDTGTFVTFAGVSPNGSGAVDAGVTGTVTGGFTVDMTGESGFQTGYQGTHDNQCDETGACANYEYWNTFFFTVPGTYSYTDWGWIYDPTCPSNGHWENTSAGNSGDITGAPDLTCVVVTGTGVSVPMGPINSAGYAKLTNISSTSLRLGLDNAFQVTFHGESCVLKLWGGDLPAPVYAQMVPGSQYNSGGQNVASFVLSDLVTGGTLVDFQGQDVLNGIHVACIGPSGSTANGGEMVVSIYR